MLFKSRNPGGWLPGFKSQPHTHQLCDPAVSLPGLTCMTGIIVARHEEALAHKLAYKACTSPLGTWLCYPHMCVCVYV